MSAKTIVFTRRNGSDTGFELFQLPVTPNKALTLDSLGDPTLGPAFNPVNLVALTSFTVQSDALIPADFFRVNGFLAEFFVPLAVSSLDSLSDVRVTDPNKGVVLRSPNGTYFRTTVDDLGSLITVPV